jgi:hypothetical protein
MGIDSASLVTVMGAIQREGEVVGVGRRSKFVRQVPPVEVTRPPLGASRVRYVVGYVLSSNFMSKNGKIEWRRERTDPVKPSIIFHVKGMLLKVGIPANVTVELLLRVSVRQFVSRDPFT